ncbi:MAG: alpha/beta hydrolase [Bacteroidetes bacterium B1(2017)]|nr:MAG: alpha/beta hydrolase [Bacteroidetes bacterium B1(2017)]
MLNYLKTGSGNTTLVLIHGYCENNTCFTEQVLFFKDHATVIAIDLPGFGSSPSKAGITIEQMAELVQDVLAHENIQECILIGHSMGGYVTLAFAELFPSMLLGFGLIHSTTFADTDERKAKRLQVISFIEENGKEAYIKNFIPGLFAPTTSKEISSRAISEGLISDAEGIKAAALAMKDRPDRSFILKQTNLPVFFGIGKLDALIPEQAMFEQAAMCNKAYVAYLQKSAHMGMMEESIFLNQEILGFINLANLNK